MPTYAESLLNIGGAPKGMLRATSPVRGAYSCFALLRDRRRVCHDLVHHLQKGNRPAQRFGDAMGVGTAADLHLGLAYPEA